MTRKRWIGLDFGSTEGDQLLRLGTDAGVIVLNSAGLAADAALSGVIEGASRDHQGTAANSLIISNVADDGDMLFLVSDGGHSKEAIRIVGASATLELGHGMSAISAKVALTGTTIDATTDFTIDGLVLTADNITNDQALTITATNAALALVTGSGAGDDFTINTTQFMVEGDTGNVGIGSAAQAIYHVLALKDFGESDASVYGIALNSRAGETTGATANILRGIYVNAGVSGTGDSVVNNQNWTATVGLRAIETDLFTVAGSTGAITGAAGLYINDCAISGATITTQYGIYMENLTAGGTDIGISMANSLDLRSAGTILNVGNSGNNWTATGITTLGSVAIGVAGSDQGTLTLAGLTSGVVTVAVGAAAGTWTMTLPAAVGAAGEQLTDAAGNGVTSWAAAGSLREYKQDIAPWLRPQDALDQMLGTQVYQFHYREGRGTLDTDTRYVGLMADEAPWAMHYGGGIVNPVNTLGYMVLGFQAQETRFSTVEDRLEAVEEALDIVRAQVVALGATPEA